MAAALTEVLGHEPIVVGGVAEDLYTGEVYEETDLDLCGWTTREEETVLRELGFKRRGRHWFHVDSKIAVEFPESLLDGDESRVMHRAVGSTEIAVIGVDDLYVDRIRRATADEGNPESEAARAALAVAVAAYEEMDWRYVERAIRMAEREDPSLGRPMRSVHKRVRRRLLRALKP